MKSGGGGCERTVPFVSRGARKRLLFPVAFILILILGYFSEDEEGSITVLSSDQLRVRVRERVRDPSRLLDCILS